MDCYFTHLPNYNEFTQEYFYFTNVNSVAFFASLVGTPFLLWSGVVGLSEFVEKSWRNLGPQNVKLGLVLLKTVKSLFPRAWHREKLFVDWNLRVMAPLKQCPLIKLNISTSTQLTLNSTHFYLFKILVCFVFYVLCTYMSVISRTTELMSLEISSFVASSIQIAKLLNWPNYITNAGFVCRLQSHFKLSDLFPIKWSPLTVA